MRALLLALALTASPAMAQANPQIDYPAFQALTASVAPVPLKSAALALNIQTFINLVGYGYPNVLELADVVDFNDPKVEWVKG